MSFSQADLIAMQMRLQKNLKRPAIDAPVKKGPLERVIQDDIEEWLKSKVPLAWWDRKRMDKATTSRLGVPDFVGVYNFIPFGIEVKRPGEKVTTDQLGELKWMGLAGAATAVVYSREDAISFFETIKDIHERQRKISQ